MILYPAFRNILRNRKNSFLISGLLAVVTLVFFLGNSILEEIDAGMERSYVDNYTGQLVVKARSGESFSLFGANKPSIGDFFPIPVLMNSGRTVQILMDSGIVDSLVRQVSGSAALDIFGRRYGVFLFGAEGQEYGNFFPGIKMLSGRFPANGEEGAVISRSTAERIARETGKIPRWGDPLLLTAAGSSGFKIREVPILGIYMYGSGGSPVENLIIADVRTVRALNSIIQESGMSADESEPLPSVDDLFGGSDFIIEEGEGLSPDTLLQSAGGSSAPEPMSSEGGWNFILLRLNKGIPPESGRIRLQKLLEEGGADGEIIDWREAAGMNAMMIRFVQILYNGGFILILIAGVIAIVNILLISFYERTGEIGTLRAIGATRAYMGKMILMENLMLSLTAAFAALIAGWGIIFLINSREVQLGNPVLRSLFGGDVLTLNFIPSVALVSIGAALAAGLLSLVFPLNMALKIKPATAMAKG